MPNDHEAAITLTIRVPDGEAPGACRTNGRAQSSPARRCGSNYGPGAGAKPDGVVAVTVGLATLVSGTGGGVVVVIVCSVASGATGPTTSPRLARFLQHHQRSEADDSRHPVPPSPSAPPSPQSAAAESWCSWECSHPDPDLLSCPPWWPRKSTSAAPSGSIPIRRIHRPARRFHRSGSGHHPQLRPGRRRGGDGRISRADYLGQSRAATVRRKDQ